MLWRAGKQVCEAQHDAMQTVRRQAASPWVINPLAVHCNPSSSRAEIVILQFALQVLERVKDPLQTLVSRDQYETAYAVLAHFLLIAQRAPILFSQV